MRKGWKKVDLGTLIETQKGFAFKSSWYANFGVPIVRVSDFTDNSISTHEINYISDDLAQEHIKHELQFRDILIQTVGSWQSNPASIVGKVVTVPVELNGALLNQNAVKIIPKLEIDKRFLYYILKEENFKLHNLNHAQGAANQASITLESIRKFKFNLPPLPTQRKIASILSSYDDLIENNLKRIKLLEEKAQRTYEEWFVKMRFPGYEAAVFDEVTGLPEGWKKMKLEEIAEMKFGYAFKANLFNSEGNGMPIIRIRNIPNSNTNDYTTQKVDSKYIVRKGDLLIGMDGEFYVNTWSGPDAYLVQRVCNLVCKNDLYKGYLTEAIRHPIIIFQASIDGATVAHLGKKHLDQIEIIIPNFNIEIFNSILFEKINLSNQNRLLKEARDILLPRLMSGIIDVEDMEITVMD